MSTPPDPAATARDVTGGAGGAGGAGDVGDAGGPAGATMATAWQEYQAATAKLGELRREGSRVAAAREAAVQAARQELVAVYRRVLLQRSRLVDAAARRGMPAPRLTSEPADVAAALATMTVGPAVPEQPRSRAPAVAAFATARAMAPEMISNALRGATATLDAADALLFASDPRGAAAGRRPVSLRNAAVYGGYAGLLALAQIPLLVALLRERPGGMLALCGLGLPLVAFALGWLTIGVAFRSRDGGRVRRDPILGIAVSLIAALPVVFLLLFTLVSAISGG